MSQIKVWKIVKKRREERAAEQMRKAEERERSEEALGRRIEAGNDQERGIWDAIYGDKAKLKDPNIDSGIGTEAPSTTGKSSMSASDPREMYDGGMEMQNFEDSRFYRENGGRITVRVAQDDDASDVPKTIPRRSLDSIAKTSREPSIEDAHVPGAKSVASEAASTKSKVVAVIDPGLTLKPKSKQPKLVPLPFTIPDDDQIHSREFSDASSVATFAASEYLPEQLKRSSKTFSGTGIVEELSGRSQERAVASSMLQEPLTIPHVEDDRSSIAATVDVVSEHGDLEPALSASSDPSLEKGNPSGDNVVTAPEIPMLSLSSQEPLVMGAEAQNDGYFPTKASSPTISEPSPALDAANETKDKTSQELKKEPAVSDRHSSLLAGNLPDGGTSKVVNAYRTNEWAKYLDGADAPSIEDLRIQKKRAAEGERAAPVDVQALSQTALTADPTRNATKNLEDKAPLQPSRSTSSSAGKPTNPYRAQPSSRNPRASSGGSAGINNMERTASQTSLASSTSSSSGLPLPKGRSSATSLAGSRVFRTTSAHLGTPIAESPIEEGVETSFPHSQFTPSTSHLMSQRESIIRNRPSSTSLLRNSSGTALNHLSSPANTPGGSTMALNTLDDDDNIPLSQRKSILQQSQQQQVPSRNSSGTTTPYTANRTSLKPNNPYGQSARLSTASNLQLNTNPPHTARPHLPASSPGDAAISNWRASLAQLPTSEVQQQQELELRRRELLAEKQAVRHSRAMDERSREQRESVLGREMRRGSMMDAHREAMRKMQASVNESLRSPGT